MSMSNLSDSAGESSPPNAPSVPQVPSPTTTSSSSTDWKGALIPGVRDIIIMIGALVAIIFVLNRVLNRGPNEFSFSNATEVVAVISPIVGAITTIGAAAFGVAAGAKAGESAGQTAANTARQSAEAAVSAQQILGQQVVGQQQRRLNTL